MSVTLPLFIADMPEVAPRLTHMYTQGEHGGWWWPGAYQQQLSGCSISGVSDVNTIYGVLDCSTRLLAWHLTDSLWMRKVYLGCDTDYMYASLRRSSYYTVTETRGTITEAWTHWDALARFPICAQTQILTFKFLMNSGLHVNLSYVLQTKYDLSVYVGALSAQQKWYRTIFFRDHSPLAELWSIATLSVTSLLRLCSGHVQCWY